VVSGTFAAPALLHEGFTSLRLGDILFSRGDLAFQRGLNSRGKLLSENSTLPVLR
jgi:hypothetical protein